MSTHSTQMGPALIALVGLLISAFATLAETPPSDQEEPPCSAEQLTRTAIQFGLEGATHYERLTLRSALREDPDYELAHWRNGEVFVSDGWRPFDEAEELRAQDPALFEYRALRADTQNIPQREFALAHWCRERGQVDRERLHCARILMNPKSSPQLCEKAMRSSGLRVYHGQLMTEESVRRQQQKDEQAEAASERWAPRVEKWLRTIETGLPRARRYALQELQSTRDPEAIPVLEAVLSSHNEPMALEVVAILAKMPEPEATTSLVRHALEHDSPQVQDAAIQELKKRPLHDYVPQILDQLLATIQSTFLVQLMPDGSVRHEHQLIREGTQQTFSSELTHLDKPKLIQGYADSELQKMEKRKWSKMPRNERLYKLAMAQRRLAVQAAMRAQYVETNVALANELIDRQNSRIYPVLQAVTDEAVPWTPDAWWQWWEEYNELYSPPKPTCSLSTVQIQPHYVPVYHPPLSCFAAGTLVRTETGLMPIEQIQIGDRVLAQEPTTGELAYKVVVDTTQRPPSPLLRLSTGTSPIDTTLGHPFWVNGSGWRMAKRLQVGDLLHAQGAPQIVDSITPIPAGPAHNLIVDEFHTYFVSAQNLLVHDGTLRQPTRALTPGLELAATETQ